MPFLPWTENSTEQRKQCVFWQVMSHFWSGGARVVEYQPSAALSAPNHTKVASSEKPIQSCDGLCAVYHTDRFGILFLAGLMNVYG